MPLGDQAVHHLFPDRVGIGERPITGKYHLLSASGVVLAVCDKLEPLLKNIDQKPGATVLRGGVVVWPVGGGKR